MKGVSAVAILAHKLAVGTSNTTDAEGRGPGPAATEKIRRSVKERDSDIEVEAFYSELAQLLTVVGVSFPNRSILLQRGLLHTMGIQQVVTVDISVRVDMTR